MAYFNYNRRKSSVAQIGDTPMGGENPIRIQSMANVSTMDTEAAVAQAIRMIEAGAEYVRFTAQGEREARNLGEIRKQLNEQGYTLFCRGKLKSVLTNAFFMTLTFSCCLYSFSSLLPL